jgi:hypothetical protein
MAHRTFVDRDGRAWQVWSVQPTKVERRDRAAPIDTVDDRREQAEYRVVLGPDMAKGWLCFQSGAEKRRLAPFPRNWESLEDRELWTLLSAAAPARRQTPPNGLSIDDR